MKRLRAVRSLAITALLFLSSSLHAATALVPVVPSGLSSPVFAGHAGDGSNRLFIVEQRGVIKVLQPGASAPSVFLDIRSRVAFSGERGLLGLAFHPGYPVNGRFFVFYTRAGDGALVIARYGVSAAPDVASAAEAVLLTIPHPNNANHNGGMLAFGPDGYLHIGVGDGGAGNDPPNNAQNIETLLGKILRIDVDRPDPGRGTPYSAPADNPYFGPQAGRDEIFSLGWRNPWRFSFDRAAPHAQWVADVGQGAREEVNTPIVNGGNYGWRVYEGTACTGIDTALCNPASYLPPVFDYTHGSGRCSITGGYVYRGAQGALPPGTYVYGDYCTGEIFAWDGAAQTRLLDTGMNISSFGEDEQGELYVVDLGGTVSRIVSTTPPLPETHAVVEFHNTNLDHYFLTADAAEATAIDSGSAGPGWSRTGNTFKAGGGTTVCRFYGSVSPGPNSHFFTADSAECAQLQQLQAATPATQKRWNFEGMDFLTTAATNGVCAGGTLPLYRAYNNGFALGIDSNHRITGSQIAMQQMVSRGWANEGVVMCAPQ
ncbi:MAG: PQQ-dependent sugar dehydrogenase [Betaproteobacteria bacterium]|nr:PQQ-dependent sugar dehydrogenase [Betaproteobacteria bacterium]